MLTEVPQQSFAVYLNGRPVHTNLPSRQLAEAMILQLAPEQRQFAEVRSMTSNGLQVLMG